MPSASAASFRVTRGRLAGNNEGRGVARGKAATCLLLQPIRVTTHAVEVGQRVANCLGDALQDRIGKIGKTIVHPQALAAHLHEPGLAQIGEMTRCFRLRNAEALVDVADADFAGEQQAKDAQAGSVGKRAKRRLQDL